MVSDFPTVSALAVNTVRMFNVFVLQRIVFRDCVTEVVFLQDSDYVLSVIASDSSVKSDSGNQIQILSDE